MSSFTFEDSFFDFDRYEAETGFIGFSECVDPLASLEQFSGSPPATLAPSVLRKASDPAFQRAAAIQTNPASGAIGEELRNQGSFVPLARQWQSGQSSNRATASYEIFEDSFQTEEGATSSAQSSIIAMHSDKSGIASFLLGDVPATTPEQPPHTNSFSSLQATHALSRTSPRTSDCSLSTGYDASQMASVNGDTASVNRYSKMLAASSEDKVACWLEDSHLYGIPEDTSIPTTPSSRPNHLVHYIAGTADELRAYGKLLKMLLELPPDSFNSRIDILADHPELFYKCRADDTETHLIQHALKWIAIVPQETQCFHSLALFRMAKSVDVSFRHQLLESLKLEKSSAREDFNNMLASIAAICKARIEPRDNELWDNELRDNELRDNEPRDNDLLDNKLWDNELRDIELPLGAQFVKDTLYRSSSRNGSLAGESSSAASSIASSVSLTDWASRPRKGRKRRRQSRDNAPVISWPNISDIRYKPESSLDQSEAFPNKLRIGINGAQKVISDTSVDQSKYQPCTLPDGSAERVSDKIYHCTCCPYPRAFSSAYTWQRHEKEMHFPSSMWSCRPLAKGSYCLACGGSNNFRGCWHRFTQCWLQPLEDRTFSRQETLTQHLHGYHRLDAVLTRILSGSMQHDLLPDTQPGFDLTCYFCGQPFSDLKDRFVHISQHYELDGYTMADWTMYLDGESAEAYDARRLASRGPSSRFSF